ncbi:MAG TPA: photosynthetic reaction center cytochrome c subunit family protein [Bryobacteraceae bacterium]|nr:photosynthetic reaction center cytochrome c subunit family protein [Bryobacteraceae bacterium]
MSKIVALAVFGASLLTAASPNISGVWKADLGKSKFQGTPPTNYLVIIEQKMAIFNQRTKEEAPQIVETTGTWNQRGENRAVLRVFDNGKPRILPYQGVPTRLTASFQGNTLTVAGETPGHPDSTVNRTYELSADGQTLTVNSVVRNAGKAQQSTVVLTKQADAAGEPLRKPEELAEKHFKNVKTSLKELPASQFMDTMHYFSWSLNKPCTFCHVERKFDVDDKKEKGTARKMIDMVASIDEHNFEGHPAVRCFTCHEGHAHPLTHQQFPDEAAAEVAASAAATPPAASTQH